MVGQYIQRKEEEKRIEEEQAAKAQNWKLLVCYDDDDDEERSISLKDNIIFGLPPCVAVRPSLSTEEPDNSLSMGDEHLDTISATESNEFIKSSLENLVTIPSESEGIPDKTCDMPFHENSPALDVSKDQFEDFSDSNDDSTSNDDDSFYIDNIEYVEASPPNSELISSEVMEIVIPEVGRIKNDILLTIKDDIIREKLLNVNLFIANIEALNNNPTSSSDLMTKSSSTSLNSFLEETNTFDNSVPKFKIFCFDLEEISSGSTTARSDISLPEYEAFYDDHVKEISSGNSTTHSNSSLYDSFIFDLSINLFSPADRNDFYEFIDELAHIICPPEYDCFCFKDEPNSGDFTMDVVDDIFPTREPRVHNALPTHPTLQLNLDSILYSESLFAYVYFHKTTQKARDDFLNLNEVFGAHNVSKPHLSDDDAGPHMLGADFGEASFSSSEVDQTGLKSCDVHLAKNIEAATSGLEVLMENKELTCLGLIEEEIALCKGWVHAPGRRTYDMVNKKWKTVRPNVARFCGVYVNVVRRVQASGAGDEDYFAMALLDYEAEHRMSFTLCHCGSSSNTESGDASINLNVHVGNDEEDGVKELRRLMGRDKAKGLKKKWPRPSGSSLSMNDKALTRLMVSEPAIHNNVPSK
nr:hypothetical protein [Tanacetum cinerariifolium]